MNIKEIIRLLINCSTSDQELQSTIQDMDQHDWEGLIATSFNSELQPLLYSKLKPYFSNIFFPDFVQSDLRQAHLRTAQKNLLMLHHAGLIFKAIRSKNIPVIGLKGIYLIDNVFKNIAARPFGDIDIMVKKGDVKAVINILQSLGYEMETYFSLEDQNLDIKHVPPMYNEKRLPVEIHWSILQEDNPFCIDVNELWFRAVETKIADVQVLALSPEDLLVHLCLHFAYQHHLKYGFYGLYDIVEVINKFRDKIKWPLIVDISRTWGVERVVLLALSLSKDLLTADIPAQLLNDLKPLDVDPWVLRQSRSIIMDENSSGIMTPDLADFANKPRLFHRIKLIIERIFVPKRTLARLYGVPPKSIRIYFCYIRRFTELIQMYGQTVKKILEKESNILTGADKQLENAALMRWLAKQ